MAVVVNGEVVEQSMEADDVMLDTIVKECAKGTRLRVKEYTDAEEGDIPPPPPPDINDDDEDADVGLMDGREWWEDVGNRCGDDTSIPDSLDSSAREREEVWVEDDYPIDMNAKILEILKRSGKGDITIDGDMASQLIGLIGEFESLVYRLQRLEEERDTYLEAVETLQEQMHEAKEQERDLRGANQDNLDDIQNEVSLAWTCAELWHRRYRGLSFELQATGFGCVANALDGAAPNTLWNFLDL